MGAALGAPSVPSLSSAKGPAGYSHPEVPRGRSREGVEGAWPFHALWWPRALLPYPSRLDAPGSEGRVSFGFWAPVTKPTARTLLPAPGQGPYGVPPVCAPAVLAPTPTGARCLLLIPTRAPDFLL